MTAVEKLGIGNSSGYRPRSLTPLPRFCNGSVGLQETLHALHLPPRPLVRLRPRVPSLSLSVTLPVSTLLPNSSRSLVLE